MTPIQVEYSDAAEGGDDTAAAGDEDGVVLEALPRALYRVEIGPGDRILAHLDGDPRRNFVRILKGDRVQVQRTVRNRTRGRIVGVR